MSNVEIKLFFLWTFNFLGNICYISTDCSCSKIAVEIGSLLIVADGIFIYWRYNTSFLPLKDAVHFLIFFCFFSITVVSWYCNQNIKISRVITYFPSILQLQHMKNPLFHNAIILNLFLGVQSIFWFIVIYSSLSNKFFTCI